MENNENPAPQPTQTSGQSVKFRMGGVLNEAWEATSGSKWAIWSVIIIIGLLMGVFRGLYDLVFSIDPKQPGFWNEFLIIPILSNILIAPFSAGMYMNAIRRLRGEKVGFMTGMQYFSKWVPLAVALVIVGFVASIPLLIYFASLAGQPIQTSFGPIGFLASVVSFFVYLVWLLVLPLVADKDLSPIKALGESFRLVVPHIWKVLLLLVIVSLSGFVVLIPTLLGVVFQSKLIIILGAIIGVAAFIWLVPFYILVIGNIYHRLVDV